MLTSASASDPFSIPTATAMLPKFCARSITVLHSGALTLSVPQSVTKARSSFSSANGSSFSRGSDEIGDDLLLGDVDDDARPFLELGAFIAGSTRAQGDGITHQWLKFINWRFRPIAAGLLTTRMVGRRPAPTGRARGACPPQGTCTTAMGPLLLVSAAIASRDDGAAAATA